MSRLKEIILCKNFAQKFTRWKKSKLWYIQAIYLYINGILCGSASGLTFTRNLFPETHGNSSDDTEHAVPNDLSKPGFLAYSFLFLSGREIRGQSLDNTEHAVPHNLSKNSWPLLPLSLLAKKRPMTSP